jgi:hypothetical protein
MANWPETAHPIIAIRYLAAVDDDAMPSFRKHFVDGPYYLDHKRDDDGFGGPPRPSAVILTLAQSAYFAVQLRDRLAAMLPGAIVILEPGRVAKLPVARTLQWKMSADTLAPDLLLDFTAYVTPQPVVFGAGTFLPVVTVRVGAEFAPSTHGLVATYRSLAGFGESTQSGDGFDPHASLGGTILDLVEASDREAIKLPPILSQSLYMNNGVWDGSKVVLMKPFLFSLFSVTPEKTKTGDYTIASTDIEPLRDMIVDGVNVVLSHTAYGTLTKDFIASFDPMLASPLGNDPLRSRKLSTIQQLREAEAKFMLKTSELMSESLKDSTLAESVRQYEDEQLKVAHKAKVSAVFAMLGTVAGAASKNPSMTANADAQTLTDLAEFEGASRQVDLKVANTQSQIIVNVFDKEQHISASSLSELHAKLKTIYTAAFLASTPQGNTTQVTATKPLGAGAATAAKKQ